jgi:hypothetical protein
MKRIINLKSIYETVIYSTKVDESEMYLKRVYENLM